MLDFFLYSRAKIDWFLFEKLKRSQTIYIYITSSSSSSFYDMKCCSEMFQISYFKVE